MLVVTGTKRSGTSLWMQLFQAAGCPLIGSAFPRSWREHLEAHNPGGFFESELRRGIYHATNPHPETGHYLHPDETRTCVVKVFVPGLVKTDHAFLDRVVGSVRCWREVVASLRKMRAKEAVVYGWARAAKPPMFLPPEVEWLTENFNLVRDLGIRRYPALLVGHRALVREPLGTVQQVLKFARVPEPGDPAALAALVRQDLHRNIEPAVEDVLFDAETTRHVDLFVRAVNEGRWRAPEVLEGLNRAWQRAGDQGWLDTKVRWDDPRILGRPAA